MSPIRNVPLRPAIVPIGPSIAYIDLMHGVYALIDSEDAARLSVHAWTILTCPYGKSYARRNTSIGGKSMSPMMHRELLEITDRSIEVDHRNRNGLDNRKCNLRTATRSQNMANRPFLGHNKWGFKGIVRNKGDRRFRAQIVVDGKYISLGAHDTAEEAGAAVEKYAREAHGEFYAGGTNDAEQSR